MPDPTTSQDEKTAARKKTAPATEPAPAPEPVPEPPADGDAARYEPYPGREFFHGGRHSPLFTAMARRLEAEGATDGRHLGPDWTRAHRDAVAAWQRTLRPKGGGDTSGIPDQTAWDKLRIPRVTPLPQET
ncbi:peptidoglycan-binding protein (plasmid) [Streptomyces sp. GDS52]|uniref:peptidoglycan-binding protein n=1 Tax=Streptomyces sp. GDS52 TaxID=3406419 RepID=UPI003FD27AB6